METQDNTQSNIISSKVEGKATTSLVLGIIGMLAWILPILGLPVTIVGLIKGIKGLDSAKKTRAIVGIVLCIIGLVLTIMNGSIGAYMAVKGENEIVNKILK